MSLVGSFDKSQRIHVANKKERKKWIAIAQLFTEEISPCCYRISETASPNCIIRDAFFFLNTATRFPHIYSIIERVCPPAAIERLILMLENDI